jgi:hypothetical protein
MFCADSISHSAIIEGVGQEVHEDIPTGLLPYEEGSQ